MDSKLIQKLVELNNSIFEARQALRIVENTFSNKIADLRMHINRNTSYMEDIMQLISGDD